VVGSFDHVALKVSEHTYNEIVDGLQRARAPIPLRNTGTRAATPVAHANASTAPDTSTPPEQGPAPSQTQSRPMLPAWIPAAVGGAELRS
jgi:hypothetical protein